jgi:hypothetical protein
MEQETFEGLGEGERLLLRRIFLDMRDNLIRATGEEPPW